MDNIVDSAGLLRSMAGERWAEVYEHRGVFLEIADELDTLKARLAEAEASNSRLGAIIDAMLITEESKRVRLAVAKRLLFALRDEIAVADFGDWNLLDEVDSFRSGESTADSAEGGPK